MSTGQGSYNMPRIPDHKLQLLLRIIALVGASWISSVQATPAPTRAFVPVRPDVFVSAEIAQLQTTPDSPIAQPTAGTLVTAAPLVLDGTWQGTNEQVEISFRINGREIELVSIIYHYGDSFACSADPAYRNIQIRSRDSSLVLPLEGASFQGAVAASYDVGGVPAEGNFLIAGTFGATSSTTGTISFAPVAGPALPGGVNCLEERREISWIATRISAPTPTPTALATPSPTATMMVVPSASSASNLTATMTLPGPDQKAPEISTLLPLAIGGAILGLLFVTIFLVGYRGHTGTSSASYSGAMKWRLAEALTSAYPDPGNMQVFLDFRMNLRLQDLTSLQLPYTQQLLGVINQLDSMGRLDELITKARADRPSNTQLEKFEQEWRARRTLKHKN
jgi:hypothetical protein